MNRIATLAAAAGAVLVLTESAYALGIGVYADGGGSTINWTGAIKASGAGNGAGFAGGGLILDTCVAKDKLFNYRLNLGYGRVFSGVNFNRVNWFNTFGFGIVRTNTVRLWLGPQVGIRYAFGSYTFQSGENVAQALIVSNFFPANLRNLYVLAQGAPRSRTFGAGDIHAGLALGVNFHFGDALSLSVEVGGKVGTHIMTGKTTTTTTSTSTSTSTQIIFGNEYYEGYASVGIMYRVGEQLAL